MNQPAAPRAVERCKQLAALGRIPPWWRFAARRRWIRSFESIMALDISEVAEMLRGVYSKGSIEELANRPMPWVYGLDRRPTTKKLVEPIDYDRPSYWPSKDDD